jgi:prepilin-type N-terminal cleavage/methylation domain-containing protein
MTARRPSKGFSLIEIMVVVGILAVLAAFAVPAYLDYVASANTIKVLSHYEEGTRYLKNEMRKLKASLVMGEETLESANSNYTSVFWTNRLNEEGGRAPGGGPAYGAAVDHSLGRVGISVEGSLLDNPPTYQLVVTRPQYAGFAAFSIETATIPWSSRSARGGSLGSPAEPNSGGAGGVDDSGPVQGAGGGNNPGQGKDQGQGTGKGQGQGQGQNV